MIVQKNIMKIGQEFHNKNLTKYKHILSFIYLGYSNFTKINVLTLTNPIFN